ncbi:MAG TPA: UvrB/UvrC motif-containing protein [Verrucomicrobiae bacterium]|nr:UvrB/UvrC motif-containing protein [Verrucomicrobiae bacterium]
MSEKKMCSICKEKPATVFLTKIASDNTPRNLDLCEDCAKSKGVYNMDIFSVADADLLLGLGASQQIEQAAGGVEVKCPRCGFTQADFKKSGRLGCPECYQTFAEGLGGLLKTMHKGTRHAGKAPEALRQSRDLSDRMKTLQNKLAKAIKDEDFEQAAILRDEIKQMGDSPATAKPGR